MQIHELGTFSGVPGENDFFAIDNGSETAKISGDALTSELKVLVLSATVNSLPATITDAGITSEMVVLNSELGTPSAQTSDWTVETSNGSLTVSGSISGSTTLKLYLAKSR